MRKKTISDIELTTIINCINNGYPLRKIKIELQKLNLSLSDKLIARIVRENNLSDKLKFNNKHGTHWISEKAVISRAVRINEIIDRHGLDITNYVLSGSLLGDVYERINMIEKISKPLIVDTIKQMNLYDSIRKNYNIWTKQHQLYRSAKGADATRGIEIIRHPVTDEMRVFYKELIQTSEYNGIGRKKFHNKFGTSKKVWESLVVELGKLPSRPAKFLSGVDNLMYGKSPSYKSGIGCKGWIIMGGKRILFRSTLELLVYLYLIENSIQFNLSKHRIRYDNDSKTYCPDIVIGDTIYEIKPSKLISTAINTAKMQALQTYCDKYKLKCDYITESTYQIKINYEIILDLIEKNSIILISDKTKFLKSLNHYINAIDKN